MIKLEYIEPGSSTVNDITVDLSPGLTITETADTQGNVISLVLKSKTLAAPIPVWSRFRLTVDTQEFDYLLTSDQFDDINRDFQTTDRYVHNITLAEPITFLNNIPCPDMTFTQPGRDENGNLLYAEYKYVDVLQGVRKKSGVDYITIASEPFLNDTPKDFAFENLTMREVVEAVYGAAGLIPTLSILSWMSETVFVSFKSLEIEDEANTYTFNNITREEVSQSESFLTNTINTIKQGRPTGQIVFPSEKTYTTVSGNSTVVGPKVGSPYFQLPTPINTIDKAIAYAQVRFTADIDNKTAQDVKVREYDIQTIPYAGVQFSEEISIAVISGLFTEDMPVDITDFILLKEEFDGSGTEVRDDKIYYSKGSNKIEGLSNNDDRKFLGFDFDGAAYTELLNKAINIVGSDKSRVLPKEKSSTLIGASSTVWYNPTTGDISETSQSAPYVEVLARIEEKVYRRPYPHTIALGAPNSDDAFYWRVRIHYTPEFAGQFKQADSNKRNIMSATKFNNQQQSYADLDRVGQLQHYTLKLAAENSHSATQQIKGLDWSAIVPLTGNLTGSGFVNKRSVQVNKNGMIITYDTSPEFKVIPSVTGINNNPSALLIDPSLTLDRNILYNDYLSISRLDQNISSESGTRITSNMLNAAKETFGNRNGVDAIDNFLFNGVRIMANGVNINDNPDTFLPTYTQGIGTGIHTFININSAFGLEGKAKDTGDPNIEVQQHIYTDRNGKIDSWDLEFYSSYDFSSSHDLLALPKYQLTGNDLILTFADDDVLKDSLESLNTTLSQHFVSLTSEAVIYPGLAIYNKLATGFTANIKLVKTTASLDSLEDVILGTETGTFSVGATGNLIIDVVEEGNYALVLIDTDEPLLGFKNINGLNNYEWNRHKTNPNQIESPWS